MNSKDYVTRNGVYVIITLLTCAGLTSPCPGVIYGDRCICFPEPNVYHTWDDARRTCETLGGKLATPTSAADDTALNTLMRQSSIQSFWLGGQQTGLLWTWVVNGLELQAQGCYADNPNDSDRLATIRRFGTLTTAICLEMCHTQGYVYAVVQGGDLCWCTSYFRFYTHQQDCTIPCSGDPQDYCGGPGNNFVYKIGGAYGVWALAQPNNHNGNQKCGALDNYRGRKLSDETCSKPLMYFCTVGANHCDGRPDFHLFGSACYFLGRVPLDWYNARDACVAMAGDLTSIDNSAVQAALSTIMDTAVANMTEDTQFWVGLSRTLWRWLTGDEIAYTNWAPGEPDVGGQGCTLLSQDDGYRWLDVDCGDFNQFVCDMPLSLMTTTGLPTTTQPTTTVLATTTSSSSASPSTYPSTSSTPSSTVSATADTTASDPITTAVITLPTSTPSSSTQTVSDVTTNGVSVTTTGFSITTPSGGTTSSTAAPTVSTVPGGPNAGASTNGEEDGDLRLVLYVVLGVILLFAIIIAIIIAAGVMSMKRRRNRVADMRHLASIPNIDTPSIYSTMKEADSYVVSPQRDFPYEEFR